MKYLLHVFIWNFKRYFTKQKSDIIYSDMNYQKQSFCACAIGSTVKKNGDKWLIPINLTLFLLGLLFVIVDDYIQSHTTNTIQFICMLVACIYFIFKFDVWKRSDSRSILKLLFVFSSFISGGLTTIAYIFLVIYENIIAYGIWGGI